MRETLSSKLETLNKSKSLNPKFKIHVLSFVFMVLSLLRV